MKSDLSFHFADQKVKPLTKTIILSACSIALMVADGHFALLGSVREATLTLLGPVQSAANVPFQMYEHSRQFFQDQSKLQEENKKLLQENIELKVQISTLQTLKKNLSELEKLEKLHLSSSAEKVATAEVILVTNESPFSNRLRISKGSNDGVEAGQAVVDGNGLLGQVTVVSSHFSEVSLLTQNKQIIPVMIERTGDRALLYGTGDQVDLRYLSSEMELKVGDRLVTSGIDGIYLPGIPVAQITQAQKIVASPFYRVKCIALAGLKQARYVTILPKNALPANLARAQEETITPASEVQGNTQRSRP